MTKILPSRFFSSSITIREQVPSLYVGRNVVATVLSRPKDSLVLVSMFGSRLLVETDLNLHKGQILNLKVKTMSPKIVLKLDDAGKMPGKEQTFFDTLITKFVGVFGKTPLKYFSLREILQKIATSQAKDADVAHTLQSLILEAARYPQALALLLIPIVQDQSGGRARVAIELIDTDDYVLHFQMETDCLGRVECVARYADGVEVELRTACEDVAGYLGSSLNELARRLERFGLKRLEVIRKHPKGHEAERVDMLV